MAKEEVEIINLNKADKPEQKELNPTIIQDLKEEGTDEGVDKGDLI